MITYLRKDKLCCAEAAGREEQEKKGWSNPADTRVRYRGAGGGISSARAEIPTAYEDDHHGEAGCLPAVHGGAHQSRSQHCISLRTPLQQFNMSWMKLQPAESRSRLLEETAAHRGPTLQQFVTDCIPWEQLQATVGVWGGNRCEEGAAETKCYELSKHNTHSSLHQWFLR